MKTNAGSDRLKFADGKLFDLCPDCKQWCEKDAKNFLMPWVCHACCHTWGNLTCPNCQCGAMLEIIGAGNTKPNQHQCIVCGYSGVIWSHDGKRWMKPEGDAPPTGLTDEQITEIVRKNTIGAVKKVRQELMENEIEHTRSEGLTMQDIERETDPADPYEQDETEPAPEKTQRTADQLREPDPEEVHIGPIGYQQVDGNGNVIE